MPRRCEICSDPRRSEIDEKLVRNVANSHIALDFGFTERQVGLHKKNHVTPFVVAANDLAQQAIIDKVFEFRSEVHLPTIEKVKMMQDKLLNDLDSATEIDERIAIIKEFRGWSIEAAKIGGDYTQDKKNPADNKTIIEETIRELMAENIPEEQIREVLAERYPETVH